MQGKAGFVPAFRFFSCQIPIIAGLAEALYDCAKTGKMTLQQTIKAVIRPGEQSGFVAECVEISVVAEGATLDEVSANLREAVFLRLEGEDLRELGLAPAPSIVVTRELEALPAKA